MITTTTPSKAPPIVAGGGAGRAGSLNERLFEHLACRCAPRLSRDQHHGDAHRRVYRLGRTGDCGLVALGGRLPYFAPFVAAAIPFPLALLIDKLRGAPGIQAESRRNPVTQLFMRFITVVALLIPFVIIAAGAAHDPDLLILGLAILAGMVWVPHGWGADDPAGFIHFVLRAMLCYAAWLLVPQPLRGAAIAGAAALTYVYAIIAMKKPSSAR